MRSSFLGRLILLLIVLAGAGAGADAATLYLPRQFTSSEMGSVGLALLNPTLTNASLTFRLRSAAGATIATAPYTLAAKNQVALTLGQVFPNNTSAGWFSLDTDVSQVTGFWMYGDFVTATDGAALLTSDNAVDNPALTYFNSGTEISFANVGSSTITGTVYERDATGKSDVSVSFTLAPFALFQRSVSSLFPTLAARFDSAGYRISVNATDAKIVGTSLTPNPGKDNVVANFIYPNASHFVFPHVVDGAVGGTTYSTLLMLNSYQSSTVTATLTLRQSSGAVLTAQSSIPVSGTVRTTLTSLFGVASIDGWLDVSASSGISGTVTYTDTISGGSTAIQMQSHNGDSAIIFGHIAALTPWWTGLALANPSTTAAQVEVYAVDSSGKLIAGPVESPAASFTLPPQSKRAFLLSEILPQVEQRSNDGGYIYVRTANGVSIYGIELFFLRNGRVYSNVPPTRLSGANLGFTPSPVTQNPSGGTITVEDTFLGDSNSQPISSVQPCAMITLNAHVNSATGQTVTTTRQYRAVGPNGYVLVMFSVSGDQSAGRGTRIASVTVPCDAPAGTYTFTMSVDYNGVVTSASSTFPIQSSSGGGTSGGSSGGGSTINTGGCTPSDTAICLSDQNNDTLACLDAYKKTSSVSGIKLIAMGGAPLSGYTWTLAPGSTYPAGVAAIEPLTGIVKGTRGPMSTQPIQTFTVSVSDGSRSATGKVTLEVSVNNANFIPPEDPTTGNILVPCGEEVFEQPDSTIILPNARAGKAYGFALPAYGIPGPLTWSVSGGSLPPGMVVDQDRGVVRGTPFSSASGQVYRFHVSITSGGKAAQGNAEYVLTVQ